MSGKENKKEALQEIVFRLQELEEEKQQLLQKKQALEEQQETVPVVHPFSTHQKVSLFLGLFKGRTSIYAHHWQNQKGRSGYSVACHNEWIKGLCHKPKIKCGECANQNYKALDDQAIYEHLTGKQVVGLYPLRQDNTCFLLAADFDKKGWQDVVKALAKACAESNVPFAIEISRSGNGAHLWIFFSEAVLARDARLLGFGLLDKAMEIYPSLSFESYDRLFPNQDLLPDGGFGNLIALPLQLQARQHGNSQFVDEQLNPFPDQWVFLSQVEKVGPEQLDNLLAKLALSDAVNNGYLLPPWEQGLTNTEVKIENCPKQITITLANHLYIKLDELPLPLTAALKRLASFSNPVFFKTQALRFSTHSIPRYISCARIEQGYLSLPRGCLDGVIALIEAQNIAITFDDKRSSGKKINDLVFLGVLRKDQLKAVNVMIKHDTGVLHAPTAFGKTVTAIGMITKRKVNTLILTHNRQLLDQWQVRVNAFLKEARVGIIGGGKRNPSGQIDIATYQSLINKKDNSVDPIVQEYGQIIIDECHHVSAPRYEMVLNELRAKYILGLTATPDRQDGHQKIIFMLVGSVRHKVQSDHSNKFEQQVVITQIDLEPPKELMLADNRPHISAVYRWLSGNRRRSEIIISDVAKVVAEGKFPLVLTERREHAELMSQLLEKKGFKTVVLKGAMRVKERKQANEKLAETQVVVATGKYIGEGFDLPQLDTLFLALPIAWKGSLTQYAGRIHRESQGKDRVTIFDYVDVSLPMLQRMYLKREKGYKAMGYQIIPVQNSLFDT